MATKSRLDEEVLAKLGLKKLAELVLDEANRDASFRRRVSAAVAANKGPEAVAAVIDRRLAGLARARGFVEWEDSKTFAGDLHATVTIIAEELGKIDPDAAIDRLIRFLATAETVFERVDDSSGRIQAIYYDAADAMAGLASGLPPKRKASLPDRLHRLIVEADHGFCAQLFEQVLPILPASAIDAWDSRIAEEASTLGPPADGDIDWGHRAKLGLLVRLRQAIADQRGDCDAFMALELSGNGGRPDTLAIAERLLRAGRHAEALEWVSKPGRPRVKILTWTNAGDVEPAASETPEQIRLELRILEAMGDRKGAQTLRWTTFLELLDTALLREHVQRLADFEEFEVLERAFAHATAFKDKYRALKLFLSWPRLDLASRLVAEHRAQWDGRDYWILAPAAETLEQDHPLAATILYRALLNQILAGARAKAYAHAANYLASLDALAGRIEGDDALTSHATYKAELQKKHGRKSGFWAQVKDRAVHPTSSIIRGKGRRP